MSGRESLAGVGKTALGAASLRAQESGREDRLFDDPYAREFVNAAPDMFPVTRDEFGQALPDVTGLGAVFAWHVTIRTRFYDDYLATASHAGCRQVVLLAAGLDTRAFRLDWPAGTQLFEIDLPDVMAFKQQVLNERSARPGCRRTVITEDLRASWPRRLTAAGFTSGSSTAWLVEGLLIYLSAEEATRLLSDITAMSGPDSQIAFEHGGTARRSMLDEAGAMPAMSEFTAQWKGGMGDGGPAWLSARGWRVHTHNARELANAWGRPAPPGVGGGFLTAVLDESR